MKTCTGIPGADCPGCWVDVPRSVGDRERYICVPPRKTYSAPMQGCPGGTKHDEGKPRLSLISRDALIAEGDVLTFGARKYEAHNWRKGFDWSRLIDATLRHVTAFNDGEDTDPETGLSHLAHARATLGFLIEHQTRGLGRDDRFQRVGLHLGPPPGPTP